MMSDVYEGPQPVAPEQFDAVIDLSNRVFRPNGGDMRRQFPLLYDPQRPERLRIICRDGQPVASAGMIVDELIAFECSTRVASIGAVCTDPSARGQGLAGRLMDDAVQRAEAAGASLMLISGRRSLYARRGAVAGGRLCRYTIARSQLPVDATGPSIEKVTPEDCAEALAFFEAERIHLRRTVADYAVQVACEWNVDRPGKTYLVRESGRLVAVVSVNDPGPGEDGAPRLGVVELAGSRRTVLAGLPQIRKAFLRDAEEIIIDGYEHDAELREGCRALNAHCEIVPRGGTVKILNVERLWGDFSPLLRERIGRAASEIHVRAEGDEMKIHTVALARGEQELRIEGAEDLTAALLGSPGCDPLATREGPLAEVVRAALPLPIPQYGLNYL